MAKSKKTAKPASLSSIMAVDPRSVPQEQRGKLLNTMFGSLHKLLPTLMNQQAPAAKQTLMQRSLEGLQPGQSFSSSVQYAPTPDERGAVMEQMGVPVERRGASYYATDLATGEKQPAYDPAARQLDPKFFDNSKYNDELETQKSIVKSMEPGYDLSNIAGIIAMQPGGDQIAADFAKYYKAPANGMTERQKSILSLADKQNEIATKKREEQMKMLQMALNDKDQVQTVRGAEQYAPVARAGSGRGSEVDKRLLSKAINPKATSSALVKTKAAFDALGDFNPANNEPVAGVGGWGRGFFERYNVLDPNAKMAANQNWSAIMDAVAHLRHDQYGSALTTQEAKSFAQQSGIEPTSDPAVIRKFMNKLVNEYKMRIEGEKAGFGQDVVDAYENSPGSFKGSQFDQFLVERPGQVTTPEYKNIEKGKTLETKQSKGALSDAEAAELQALKAKFGAK